MANYLSCHRNYHCSIRNWYDISRHNSAKRSKTCSVIRRLNGIIGYTYFTQGVKCGCCVRTVINDFGAIRNIPLWVKFPTLSRWCCIKRKMISQAKGSQKPHAISSLLDAMGKLPATVHTANNVEAKKTWGGILSTCRVGWCFLWSFKVCSRCFLDVYICT